MAFRPLHDSDPDRLRLSDAGLLVIRLLTVLAFLYYQLAGQLRLAAGRVLEGAEWTLEDDLATLGAPMPGIAALGGLAIFSVALVGVVSGLFTRLGSFLALLVVGFLLFSGVPLSESLNPQALVLYLSVFAGLACGGGGKLSLDHLLSGKRARDPKE
jgi:uncharacterized membrane protein YphA (DoxX/SURF4 family)